MIKEKLIGNKYEELVNAAKKASRKAYTPYSHFQVGAALLDINNKIWTGCNIESASYTPTNCAERTAIFKAVSEGIKEFKAIAIVGRDESHEELTVSVTAPCGVCRQVLAEFCGSDFEIVLANNGDEIEIWTMDEILPLSFTKSNLDDAR